MDIGKIRTIVHSCSTCMIRLKALSLTKDVKPEFKTSEGWVRKFQRRNNLVLRAGTSMAQALPADLKSKLAQFRQSIHYARQNGDFPYTMIAKIIMDETPVFFIWYLLKQWIRRPSE